MIFQNPGASLNPVFRVGDQLLGGDDASPAARRGSILRERVVEILTRVGIPSPRRASRDYPHQFSGGMAQRVMIGMGISCVPSLLIADEPTTALDVTIQAQVLALIRQLARETGLAVLLVSHDLGIISQMCHRVIVMYAGRVVEEAPVAPSSARPRTPTRGAHRLPARLDGGGRLGAIPGVMPGLRPLPTGCRFHPRCPIAEPRCTVEAPALRPLRAEHAWPASRAPRERGAAASSRSRTSPKHFPLRGNLLAASGRRPRASSARSTASASRSSPGETLGLVGESGCGKTTTGRLVLRAIEPTRGRIVFEGEDITALPAGRLLPFRRRPRSSSRTPTAR